MVANPKKLGVGQNIQFSHYQIFFSNSRSYVTRDQAIGRQHRQGQKEKVTVIDLITEDTVDELALEALKAKQDLNLTLSELSRVLKNPKEINKIISKSKLKSINMEEK
jgi:SNF2 family DNA or RNA helicase